MAEMFLTPDKDNEESQFPEGASVNNLTVFIGESVFARTLDGVFHSQGIHGRVLSLGYAHGSNTVGGPVDDWRVGLASPR